MDRTVRQIVVVGGGSAGWLCACLLAAEHGGQHPGALRITLVESAAVAPIGVGEGTWPSMRDTLRRIGVSEADLIRSCDVAFKQGSRFDGWVDGGAQDSYYHPFSLPLGYGDVDLVAGWLQRHGDQAFAPLVSAQPHVCHHGLAPKQVNTPEFSAVANYAYHFDAGKFGLFLRQHGVDKLGVHHVVDDVLEVVSSEDGDIAALRTRDHGMLEGDLFVDCTGMAALLIGGHYGIALREQKSVLVNDAALAAQVPYPAADTPIASQTIGTAQTCGWTWDIGLPTRRGVGLVYSTAFTSDEDAERVLQAHIERTGGPAKVTARRLRFAPGYRERFWHRNCVAVGLSSGFIEPLEASALALVEMSAAMLCDEMPATRSEMELVAQRFNEVFAYRWSRVIDFLKLHYVLSKREDSEYWRAQRDPATVPDRLRELLSLWRHRAPYRHDLQRVEEVFPSASYQFILYGMGFRPEPTARLRRPQLADAAEACLAETAALTRRMLAGLPRHRELLEHICGAAS